MYICVHDALGLLGLDRNGFSDPYCVIYCNGKKVFEFSFFTLFNNNLPLLRHVHYLFNLFVIMITNYSLLLIKSRWKIVMLNNLKTTAATVTLLIVFSLRCTIIYVRVIMRVLVGEDDALRHRDEESSVGRFNGNHRQ